MAYPFSYFVDNPKKTKPKIIIKEINQSGKSQPKAPSKNDNGSNTTQQLNPKNANGFLTP